MRIGLRVVKTVIAIAISILIARLFHLKPDHFAGIVSMLAVQPSVYRSLRDSLSHLFSALFAAILGITAAYLFGGGPLVFAVAAFLVMALHVWLRRTTSLTLAVIVAINTIGTSAEFAGTAAFYQILLVFIGMSVGTAINLILKPVHREREEELLSKSETMLRSLLYYVEFDLLSGKITPYKPDMRKQIEEVRIYIEKGKNISRFIREDRWLSRTKSAGDGDFFRIYETMVERIRDLVKALQKTDLTQQESKNLIRVIGLIARGQERMMKTGKRMPLALLYRCLQLTGLSLKSGDKDISRLFPYYQAYEALTDYLCELEASREHLKMKIR